MDSGNLTQPGSRVSRRYRATVRSPRDAAAPRLGALHPPHGAESLAAACAQGATVDSPRRYSPSSQIRSWALASVRYSAPVAVTSTRSSTWKLSSGGSLYPTSIIIIMPASRGSLTHG